MSYIARVYKKKFLETNGLDITIIDILLKKRFKSITGVFRWTHMHALLWSRGGTLRLLGLFER